MDNEKLKYIRLLTRELAREFELIKDHKYPFKLSNFSRHLLLEHSFYPEKNAGELAKSLLTDKANISRSLKTLIGEGYLVESTARKDKRKKVLKLTSSGAKIVKIVNDYSNTRLRNAFDPILKKDLDKIIEGLELINSALSRSKE